MKVTKEQVAEMLRLVSEEKLSYVKAGALYGISGPALHGHAKRAGAVGVRTQPAAKKSLPPPPRHTRVKEDKTPAEWKHYLSRVMEGSGDDWNEFQTAAYVIKALDNGVKDQVILDKTGLCDLKWYRKMLAIGEAKLWAEVIRTVKARYPDLPGLGDAAVEGEEGEDTALARSGATALTTQTPAGATELARISDLLPAPFKPAPEQPSAWIPVPEKYKDAEHFAPPGAVNDGGFLVSPPPPPMTRAVYDEMCAENRAHSEKLAAENPSTPEQDAADEAEAERQYRDNLVAIEARGGSKLAT